MTSDSGSNRYGTNSFYFVVRSIKKILQKYPLKTGLSSSSFAGFRTNSKSLFKSMYLSFFPSTSSFTTFAALTDVVVVDYETESSAAGSVITSSFFGDFDSSV